MHGWHNVDPMVMVLVSEAYKIRKEWRFWVVGNQVITGSLYFRDGKLDMVEDDVHEYGEARMFAEDAAMELYGKDVDMDPIYVLDVCKCGDKFYVLEFNAASCSGFYKCDVGKIVGAMNEQAEKMYENIF